VSGVIGIGIDMIDTGRIAESLEKFGDRFKKRVFLPAEIDYCDKHHAAAVTHFAARFAAKEAVSKAFGTGIGKSLGWQDIEVVRNEATGEPSIVMRGKGADLARARGVERVMVSLTHTRDYAAAQAMLIGVVE
jgi:holo-[acyl-carrier protein] synthase